MNNYTITTILYIQNVYWINKKKLSKNIWYYSLISKLVTTNEVDYSRICYKWKLIIKYLNGF